MKTNKLTLKLPLAKPRNPFALSVKMRGGEIVHNKPTARTQRRVAKVELKQGLRKGWHNFD